MKNWAILRPPSGTSSCRNKSFHKYAYNDLNSYLNVLKLIFDHTNVKMLMPQLSLLLVVPLMEKVYLSLHNLQIISLLNYRLRYCTDRIILTNTVPLYSFTQSGRQHKTQSQQSQQQMMRVRVNVWVGVFISVCPSVVVYVTLLKILNDWMT